MQKKISSFFVRRLSRHQQSINMLGYQNTLRQPPRTRLSSNQEAEAIERVWRMYWPYRRATIIAILILLYGLTLVGLEAAKLDVEGETDANPKTASITLPAIRLRIGVGIWSGAVIAVAAITVLIISEFSLASNLSCMFPSRLHITR